ncbi:protein disulfide isomerase, partial [Colletotrichum sojae]
WNSQLLEAEWSTITDHEKDLLSINCAADTSLCEEHDVRSFPAIRLYRSAKTFEHYRGPRQANEISAFVNRSLRPLVSGLGPENITTFTSADSHVFVLHLTEEDAGAGLYRRFHELASRNAHLYSFGVIPRKRVHRPSFLDCFNNLDDTKNSTTEFYTNVFSLDEFVDTCTTRLIPEMTHKNKKAYTESKTNVLYFFDFNSARREQFATDVRDIARKVTRGLKFVTVDPPSFPDVPASVGLRWNFPAIALQNNGNGLMYPSESSNDITAGFVERFLCSVADGKAKPAFHDYENDYGQHDADAGARRHDEL